MSVKTIAYIAGALLLALIGTNAAWLIRCTAVAGERDTARLEREQLRADIADQRAEFEAAARQKEREQHNALAGIRVIFNREMTDAKSKHDAVVADLRAGTLRLRRHWEARLATAELSAAAAAGARADGDADLRAADAARLVRAAAECDARITALQSYARLCSGGTP